MDGEADRVGPISLCLQVPLDGIGRVRGLHAYILLAATVLALAYAPRLNSYWMHVAIIAMFYAILAASWRLRRAILTGPHGLRIDWRQYLGLLIQHATVTPDAAAACSSCAASSNS
jgi:hypothetical protein